MKLPVRCRHAMSVSAPPRPPCHLAAALAEMAAHHHRPLALEFGNFDMILSVSESSLHCIAFLTVQYSEKVMWRKLGAKIPNRLFKCSVWTNQK